MDNKFISGLVVGTIVGTALTIYLNSDKGKQLLADLNFDVEDIKDQMNARIEGVDESLHQLLSRCIVRTGRSLPHRQLRKATLLICQ